MGFLHFISLLPCWGCRAVRMKLIRGNFVYIRADNLKNNENGKNIRTFLVYIYYLGAAFVNYILVHNSSWINNLAHSYVILFFIMKVNRKWERFRKIFHLFYFVIFLKNKIIELKYFDIAQQKQQWYKLVPCILRSKVTLSCTLFFY